MCWKGVNGLTYGLTTRVASRLQFIVAIVAAVVVSPPHHHNKHNNTNQGSNESELTANVSCFVDLIFF